MDTDVNGSKDYNEYMNSDRCYELIRKAALLARKRLESLNLYDEFMSYENDNELENELFLVLNELINNGNIHVISYINQNDMSRLTYLVVNAFINKVIDRHRSQSPWHAYYRHVRQVLSQERTILYQATQSGSFYSLDHSEQMDTWEPMNENYATWQLPEETIVNFHHKKEIVRIARHFYAIIKSKYNASYWVPVRELVKYISHLEVNLRHQLSKTNDDHIINDILEVGCPESIYVNLTYNNLKTITKSLSLHFTEKERIIFYLRWGARLGLEEIARKVGLKAASGVHHHLDKVYEKIREVCNQWPGLSPEDLDEQLFSAFSDSLVEFCKGG